jgi:hypothetical protein
MKKLLSLWMTLAVIASAFGLQVNRAQAADWITYEDSAYVQGKGIVYIFSAAGHKNKDVKGASIYVGSDFYDLFCWLTEDKEHIVCNAQGGLTQFAGQTAIIYLAGQIFYVTIPGAGGPSSSGPLVCPDGLVPGADVMVDFGNGPLGPFFVPGSTLAEVQSQAESWFSGASIDIVSGLYCGEEPS